jgi:hypothetical protein
MKNNFLIGVFLILLSGCSKHDLHYFKLKMFCDDASKATNYAKKLLNTNVGIKHSLKDFDIRGGKTRGWSIWILTLSTNTYVNKELELIAYNEDESIERKTQAFIILWNRTTNTQYLMDCYPYLIEQGPISVFIARKKLCECLYVYTNMNYVILKQNNNRLSLSKDEFNAIIKKSSDL